MLTVVKMQVEHIDPLLRIEQTSSENFWNRNAFRKHLIP